MRVGVGGGVDKRLVRGLLEQSILKDLLLDGRGRPLDGGPTLDASPTRSLRGQAPNPLERQLVARPMPLAAPVISTLRPRSDGTGTSITNRSLNPM